MRKSLLLLTFGMLFFSCMQQTKGTQENEHQFTGKEGEVSLIVLAPGHFHANLLQKKSIPQLNDTVSVYAFSSEDAGLRQYLSAIESFNGRTEDPTTWHTSLYTGYDFLDKMVIDKKGNVVVLAGNNKEKTEYLSRAVDAGFNVLSDKPMAINREDFILLVEAYSNAEANNLLLYDMMTERYDLLNIIEKELVNDSAFFGELQPGAPDDPAVYMESVHHFFKEVAGTPLTRPAWYYDVEQQGEGIADVTTHLIDLLFWKCFPDQVIDYKNDISNISASRWPTVITLQQFTQSTGESSFPVYLQKNLDEDLLEIYANGSLNFSIMGHDVNVKVVWNYQSLKGEGDTFNSTVKGTKATLKTIQNKEQNFVKQLYAEVANGVSVDEFEASLKEAIVKIQLEHPYVSFTPTTNKGEYLIQIPVENREGHESHFRYVAERFFSHLVNRDMPEWEKTNTLAKYYITTTAVEFANK